MPYQFATAPSDYTDLASGQVLYGLPGYPALPVRLADEVFQRLLARRRALGLTELCTLYDPCCGAGYSLSVIAYLHWRWLDQVIGSDVDHRAVQTARRNLGLLHVSGLDQRLGEIAELFRLYGKESHRLALESARHLRRKVVPLSAARPLTTQVFQADALDGEALRHNLKDVRIDLVFADVPYGLHSQWLASSPEASPDNALGKLLEAILQILTPDSLVALVSDKSQKAAHARYLRLEQFQIGKRRITLLQPVS